MHQSAHPGASVEDVVENTAFEICVPDDVPETAAPTAEEMALIERFDPNNLRGAGK